MSNRKRFLLLGSVSILLLAGLAFTLSPRISIAHAACSQACPINPCPPGLSENDNSNNTSWVEVLQYALNSEVVNSTGSFTFPNSPLTIDGNFESKTETAVADWQQYWQIPNGNGAVGDRTWESLGLCPGQYAFPRYGGEFGSTCPPSQAENDSSNAPVFVQAIQDMINLNYQSNFTSNSTPDSWSPYLASDGSFGAQTHNAVADFQDFNRIMRGNGAVGDRTWMALNMCF